MRPGRDDREGVWYLLDVGVFDGCFNEARSR